MENKLPNKKIKIESKLEGGNRDRWLIVINIHGRSGSIWS